MLSKEIAVDKRVNKNKSALIVNAVLQWLLI